VGDLLRKKGFFVQEMGDVVRNIMMQRHLEITTESLRNFSQKLRETGGQSAVAKQALDIVKRSKSKNKAIIGVRSMHELEILKKTEKNMAVIAVYAPEKTRFERIIKRGKKEDPKNRKEFRWIAKREMLGFSTNLKEVKYGLKKVMQSADYVLLNTGSLVDLKKNLDVILKTINMSLGKK
jgi:dephospho-CoA kinase